MTKPCALKVAAVCTHLQKPSLDPTDLDNHKLVSIFSQNDFMSKHFLVPMRSSPTIEVLEVIDMFIFNSRLLSLH